MRGLHVPGREVTDPTARILPASASCAIACTRLRTARSCRRGEVDLVQIDRERLQRGDPVADGAVNASCRARPTGSTWCATVTSPGEMPACVRPALRQRSELPFPYISAVSNQVMPPSSAALTMQVDLVLGERRKNLETMPGPGLHASKTDRRYLYAGASELASRHRGEHMSCSRALDVLLRPLGHTVVAFLGRHILDAGHRRPALPNGSRIDANQ